MRNTSAFSFSCSASSDFITSMAFSFSPDLPREIPCLSAEVLGIEKLGAKPHRLLDALQKPPLADLLMMPGYEHLGHAHPPELFGPGVVRVLEEPLGEALLLERLPRDHALHQPGNRIYHHHRRGLAARKDVVTDGNLVGDEGVDHPLVDPFVSPAQEGEIPPARQLLCRALREKP